MRAIRRKTGEAGGEKRGREERKKRDSFENSAAVAKICQISTPTNV